MLLRHLIKNEDNRKRVAHIGAAVVILINSYENYESGKSIYKLFAIAGLLVLILALFHQTIEKKMSWIDGVFFVIEGILSLIVAFNYFHLGKKALPITFLFLALFQFYLAFRKGKKGTEIHKSTH
jgi:DNA integrity scanning protein DisA with diadenylate cyclase activity